MVFSFLQFSNDVASIGYQSQITSHGRDSGFEMIRISQCASPRVFGFMIKKAQIGDQIDDPNKESVWCHPEASRAALKQKIGEAALFPDDQRSVWLSGTNPGTNYQCAISCPGLEGSHFCRLGTTPSDRCSFGPEERRPITL
jgi:hypothetical protein